MTDTARDYQTLTAADTNGLDDLFEEGLLDQQKESLVLAGGVLSCAQGIPVDIAAARLGLSVSGVLKRLRKGVLPGFKVPAKRGEKWLVSPEALPEGLLEAIEDSSIEAEGVLCFSEDSSGALAFQPEESSIPPAIDHSLVEDLKQRNGVLEAQLQAATWRNGYLEAQLEAERQQVKLLTDSQHKQGLWIRFLTWLKNEPK